jgi:hypothetical protein
LTRGDPKLIEFKAGKSYRLHESGGFGRRTGFNLFHATQVVLRLT